MGKLVLYLVDGTTMDVPLDKERLTIGRRADNDVCLPYPAVSGEHAAVVTILADSFLEDLGSTNGTLVNNKAIAKHFLVDNDHIDIGRQRFVYKSENDAKVEPLPPDVLRHQLRGLTEKVATARLASPVGPGLRAPAVSRAAPLDAEIEHGPAGYGGAPGGTPASASQAVPVARTPASLPPVAGVVVPPPQARAHGGVAPVAAAAATGSSGGRGSAPAPDTSEVPDLPPAASAPPAPTPSVRVLSGPSAGRTLPLTKDELSIGRVGAQVAVVRRTAEGYRLVPLEGASPPKINGAAVAPGGSPLHPGDTFEIAGVRLELSVGALGAE